jgi:hypothetical protein
LVNPTTADPLITLPLSWLMLSNALWFCML